MVLYVLVGLLYLAIFQPDPANRRLRQYTWRRVWCQEKTRRLTLGVARRLAHAPGALVPNSLMCYPCPMRIAAVARAVVPVDYARWLSSGAERAKVRVSPGSSVALLC